MQRMPIKMKNSVRADIIDWRSRYLVKIKEYQDKGHPIFYMNHGLIAT
jgi:hypothetical protein